MNIRCFISINLDDQIIKKVSEVIDLLTKYEADIKWVEPENLHLTLKFLGNVPEEKIFLIKNVLTNIAENYHPFYIKIQGTGVFPNKKYPRILWVGIEKNEIILDIHKQIETELFLMGYKKEEKEFNPHLTIGRTRSFVRINNILDCLDNYKEYYFGTLLVDKIHIMRSDLSPKGSKYTKLVDIILK